MNNLREEDHARERHPSIELSDLEHLQKLRTIKVNKVMEECKIIAIHKEQKGVKNEKSKSKVTERKPKKVPTKSNKSAMAGIQKKL